MNFTEQMKRDGEGSIKWRRCEERDVLSFWLADMEFPGPTVVQSAVKEAFPSGVWGYTDLGAEYRRAAARWIHRRQGIDLDQNQILPFMGMLPAMAAALHRWTKKDDQVLIFTPVYRPFYDMILDGNRHLVPSPLIEQDRRYHIDWDALTSQLSSGVSAMLLCQPHNPVGRVWTEEELKRLARLCAENDVLMISDEIHIDLMPAGTAPAPSLYKALAQLDRVPRHLVLQSPSKSFNIMAYGSAYALLNPELDRIVVGSREKPWSSEVGEAHKASFLGHLPASSYHAAIAACTHGDQWLEKALVQVDFNYNTMGRWAPNHGLELMERDGTYFAWLKCDELLKKSGHDDSRSLVAAMKSQARVWFGSGAVFGDQGDSFLRVTLACQGELLEAALERLDSWVASL